MHIFEEYKWFISELDRRCHRIAQRHADQIACTKGCAGNCCRIHLSIYPVEAFSMALALQKLPPELQLQIQDRARQTGSFSPCPLLEDRACLIYDARAVICRTHGLPIATEYRDQRTVGFCVKNFKQSDAIPEKDIIDLAHLNGVLAELNMNFVRDGNYLNLVKKRYTIAEAMLQRWP